MVLHSMETSASGILKAFKRLKKIFDDLPLLPIILLVGTKGSNNLRNNLKTNIFLPTANMNYHKLSVNFFVN